MMTNCAANEGFEISPRFRRTVEERIARLEALQRGEALRMRLFLDRARPRPSWPLIAL
jgi:ribosome-associated translation inhibitor RaiA